VNAGARDITSRLAKSGSYWFEAGMSGFNEATTCSFCRTPIIYCVLTSH